MTKDHRLGSLNNRHLILTVLKARNPRSRYWPVWFLACRWPPSLCVLTWHRERETERDREKERSINPTVRPHPHDLI